MQFRVGGADVVEVAVVVQHRGPGVDGDGGERDIDDAGRPAGSGVPQCGADVEDELVDSRRQVRERCSQAPGGLGVFRR